MQQGDGPDITGFQIDPAEECAKGHTGDQLPQQAEQCSHRTVVIEIQRQMPQSSQQAQQDHALSRAKTALQDGLQVVTPTVLLTKHQGEIQHGP